jgi:hypothetical protein
VEAHLALQPGDQPEEDQPEQHGERAEHPVDDRAVLDEQAAESAEQAPLVMKTALKPSTNSTEPSSTRARRTGVSVRTSVSPAAARRGCRRAPDRTARSRRTGSRAPAAARTGTGTTPGRRSPRPAGPPAASRR